MRKKVPLGSSANNIHSRRSREEVINCYFESTDDGEFKRIGRAPLFEFLSTVGSGPIRGFCKAAGALYLVSGSEFYKVQVSPFGGISSTLKGSVFGNSGLVSMAAIGTDQPQVIAITNNAGFLYDDTTGLLAQITDPNFTPDYSVVGFNQRFYLNKPNSNEFFCSDVYPGGATYNAINFASAENITDLNVAVTASNTVVLVMGESSVQGFQDIGISTGFPLRPIEGGTFQRGCASAQSVITVENVTMWLADDYTVRMLAGGQMMKISDLAFDQEVLTYNFPNYAFAQYIDYPYYKAYCLTFPGNNVTWCYDVGERKWHKRDSKNVDGWRIQTSILFNNMTILGDRFNGKLYKMDSKVFSEAGQNVDLVIRIPPVFSDEANVNLLACELVCDMGTGLIGNVDSLGIVKNQPIEPKIALRISREGGYNYTSYSFRSLGRIGQYMNKVIWRLLGFIPRTNECVLEFTVNDPVDFNAYALYIDLEPGIV